jgi:aromatic amino acid permease
LLGMGCIIGNGFFLGSNIALQRSGYTVLLLFICVAVATYIVFEDLAKMTAAHPVQGSFRTYAKQAYGRWAGFSSGWIYWSSEMLISGSSLLALSIFTPILVSAAAALDFELDLCSSRAWGCHIRS